MSEPLAYSPRDAATALSIGLTRLYQLLAEGRLNAVKAGTRTLVLADSMRAYLDSLPPAQITTGRKEAA